MVINAVFALLVITFESRVPRQFPILGQPQVLHLFLKLEDLTKNSPMVQPFSLKGRSTRPTSERLGRLCHAIFYAGIGKFGVYRYLLSFTHHDLYVCKYLQHLWKYLKMLIREANS